MEVETVTSIAKDCCVSLLVTREQNSPDPNSEDVDIVDCDKLELVVGINRFHM